VLKRFKFLESRTRLKPPKTGLKLRSKTNSLSAMRAAISKAEEHCRARGSCERCGTVHELTAHHIIARRHRAVSALDDNLVCLCFRCHICWAHVQPAEFRAWLEERYPGRYDALKRLSNGVEE